MKYLLLISIYIATHAKSDDTAYLETIYTQLNHIYARQLQKQPLLEPTVWKEWTQPINYLPKTPIKTNYDFIIVGAGSAGSVLANRLSEIPEWRVLLLEAGKGENLVSQVPLAAPTMPFTPYNWNHVAEYQPNVSFGMNQHRMKWPRGKALGGTTVINFMIYTRGNKHDYDRWAEAGNPGWSYQEVLPYYMKSEAAKLTVGDHRFHGKNGYWSVEETYQSPLVYSFIEAGNELGLPHFDYNTNVSFGVSTIQGNLLKGRRHTAAGAFLHPVRHRKNLHIQTSAFVTKILIDDNKRVYGVEYEKNNKKYTVGAKREVVLSAGTFNSAQLLMLAGIGPKDHLQELGIPVLEDLPVGQNLQDHLTFPGLSFLINQELSLSAYHLINLPNVLGWLANGTGPYSSLGGVEGIGYIKTPVSQELVDIPDIELLFLGGSLSTDYGLFNRRWMNIRDDVYNPVFTPTFNIPSWTIFPMLLHPKSKGYLKLQSRDPHVYPLLYGNYFTDPEEQDLNTMLYAVRFVQALAATQAFQKLKSTLNPNPIPVCKSYQFDTDEYWKCAIRAIAVTLHHQIGTVKMGARDDPTSVVNHELKVYGVRGLRVADCSVIPEAVGAHTSAVAVMVGEKAADFIKRDWGKLE